MSIPNKNELLNKIDSKRSERNVKVELKRKEFVLDSNVKAKLISSSLNNFECLASNTLCIQKVSNTLCIQKVSNTLCIQKVSNTLCIEGILGKLDIKSNLFSKTGNDYIEFEDKKIILHTSNEKSRFNAPNKKSGIVENPKSICTEIQNGISGVSFGFHKKLSFKGIGLKAILTESSVKKNSNQILELKLGQNHPILYHPPQGIKIFLLKPTLLCIFGINKQQVGQAVSDIQRFKKPEVYTGKGIHRTDQLSRLKERKKK
jgi:ribosomal protein L6P/L9E